MIKKWYVHHYNIPRIAHISYDPILSIFSLDSLNLQRIKHDLRFFFCTIYIIITLIVLNSLVAYPFLYLNDLLDHNLYSNTAN